MRPHGGAPCWAESPNTVLGTEYFEQHVLRERRKTMKIITNRIPRPLLPLTDLPEKARADFDYIDDSYDFRFVQYKGVWYDVSDSTRALS